MELPTILTTPPQELFSQRVPRRFIREFAELMKTVDADIEARPCVIDPFVRKVVNMATLPHKRSYCGFETSGTLSVSVKKSTQTVTLKSDQGKLSISFIDNEVTTTLPDLLDTMRCTRTPIMEISGKENLNLLGIAPKRVEAILADESEDYRELLNLFQEAVPRRYCLKVEATHGIFLSRVTERSQYKDARDKCILEESGLRIKPLDPEEGGSFKIILSKCPSSKV